MVLVDFAFPQSPLLSLLVHRQASLWHIHRLDLLSQCYKFGTRICARVWDQTPIVTGIDNEAVLIARSTEHELRWR
jgi:hypothetical protein